MPKQLFRYVRLFSLLVLAFGTGAAKAADPPAGSAAAPRLVAPNRPNPVQFADGSAATTDGGTLLSAGQVPTLAPRRSEVPGELPPSDTIPSQLTPAQPRAGATGPGLDRAFDDGAVHRQWRRSVNTGSGR